MKYMMIFFGLLFYKVAAGLCLYFITSSLWGMAERRLLPKKRKPGETGEVQQKLGLLERALKRQQELRAGNGTPPRREAEGANGDGKARRKAARNKQRKGNRPAGGEGRGPESGEPSGLFGRLGAWWAALLEAARKKNR
jgi:membrane protein insertase Oxa1/YidC/SpoIIIJ